MLWCVGSSQMYGVVADPEVLEDRVQVAALGEDRRPHDPGREVGDRERQQEDVEEEPAAAEAASSTSSAIASASANWSGMMTPIRISVN